MNPNATPILEKNKDKIIWEVLTQYTDALYLLFDYDYHQMRDNSMDFAEELCKFVFHPKWIQKMAENAHLDSADYMELL
jgi:hypothetical protein